MDNEKILNADGGRTPIGSLDGALKDVPADERGATAGRGAIERAGDRPSKFEGVVMGCSGASRRASGHSGARRDQSLAALLRRADQGLPS